MFAFARSAPLVQRRRLLTRVYSWRSISVASVDAAAQLFPARKPKPAGENAPQVRALTARRAL